MTTLHDLTATAQRELLASGDVRPSELVDHYLERIDALNPHLRAFTTVTADAARERAADLEAAAERDSAARTDRHRAPLWGLPLGDKDLVDRAGVPTSFGSRAFAGYIPEASAPLVTTMDDHGGISLGKTNAPELGFPSYCENLLPGGPARNPWDDACDPGGSSGGAAVAVSARMIPVAPGSDGGGSIRIPAAACGLVGLKPSRGRVPDASGIDSLGGLVVAGPIARTVGDAALLLDGMRAARDHFAVRAPAGERSYADAVTRPAGPLRIGWNTWSPWASDYDIELDPAAEAVLDEALRLLERLGHRIEHVQPTPFPEYVAAFRSIWMGGASTVPLPDSALDALEPLTAWLIRSGRARPASELAGGLAALTRFEAQIVADYAPFDVVITPALAMTPRPLGWYDRVDGERNFIQQCQYTPYTSYLNAAGLPAITLPVGDGTVPMSIQAIGRPGDEVTLLRLGRALERELLWQDRVPPIATGVARDTVTPEPVTPATATPGTATPPR